MINLVCKEIDGKLNVDIMQEGRMYVIDGEELTPIEVSKLALYFLLATEHAAELEEDKGQEL